MNANPQTQPSRNAYMRAVRAMLTNLERWLRSKIQLARVRARSRRYRQLSTQQVFEKVYASADWGGDRDGDRSTSTRRPPSTDSSDLRYNSGSGSDDSPAAPYIALVKNFVRANGVRTIVDLGCGDFRVGRKVIENEDVAYTGVDIVRPLIENLQARFGNDRTRFVCLDLITDDLPKGDVYLIRQVLQHLSNAQITRILDKLEQQLVIVTEHLPVGSIRDWNIDKAAGPDIRLYYGSGVFLDRAPFSRPATTLLEVPLPFNGRDALLRTSVISPRQPRTR